MDLTPPADVPVCVSQEGVLAQQGSTFIMTRVWRLPLISQEWVWYSLLRSWCLHSIRGPNSGWLLISSWRLCSCYFWVSVCSFCMWVLPRHLLAQLMRSWWVKRAKPPVTKVDLPAGQKKKKKKKWTWMPYSCVIASFKIFQLCVPHLHLIDQVFMTA